MAPTLSQVVAAGASTSAFNYFYLFALAAAAGAAVFSAVKGLELYRRGRLMSAVVESAPSLAEMENQKKIEKLNFLLDEIKNEKERLANQNLQLQDKLSGSAIQKQMEEVLRKSNQALAKECERLKTEREELVLKANKPLLKTSPSVKPKAKTIVKKEVARKPKRVSKKKNENS